MPRTRSYLAAFASCLPAATALGGGPWTFGDNQTTTRLVSDPALGAADTAEKDYAWGDVNHDGDTDLVVARKQPFTTAGGRANVLFLNESGVLTDRTAQHIPGFLDLTNDRDVQLVDVNNDSWLDIVTAAACNGCNPAGISDDSRLYLNLGSSGETWLGFGSPTVLIQGGNNLNAVAAGDVTGDGYADLYFVSANDSFEDQLLVNGGPGNPGVFTVENNRLTPQMRDSGFGASATIADLNGDGWNDIVKVEFHHTEIFHNHGDGTFTSVVTLFANSDEYATIGHLNGDQLPDIVVTEESVDLQFQNQGNDGNGMAQFTAFALPSPTNGFGGNSVISDLDGDGWNDVIIADVDADLPGCTGTADILHSNGNPPIVTFTADPGSIPPSLLTGVFDVAVFDVDGNGTRDLVIGRCSGTVVWITAPLIALEFEYPQGLPQLVAPEATTGLPVQLTALNSAVEPGSPALHASINGGAFMTTPLAPLGGGLYQGTLPAVACGDRIEFYVSAQNTLGTVFVDPPGAPAVTYASIGAAGTEVLFSDHIEGNVSGWTIVNDPSLTSGAWEQAVPNATNFDSHFAAPGADATFVGTKAFVTGNGPPGGNAADSDVDGGPTVLTSPVFDLQGSDAVVSCQRWVYTATGVHDQLVTEISNDGGASWTPVDTVGSTASAWQPATFFVSSFVVPTAQVRVRFVICDCPNDSITEAGIDDFRVDKIACTPPCPWDLDGSGSVDTVDFLALLAAWGSAPAGPPDFDNDGGVGVTDFLALLGHWGTCP